MSPIAWNDAAFDHLVLPGNEKQLSWDFVENKALANNNFDDFVQDKGMQRWSGRGAWNLNTDTMQVAA